MNIQLKIALVILGLACCTMPAAAQVVIIAHKDVPAESIGKDRLLDFYLRDVLSWPSSELEIVVCDLRLTGAVKDEFYRFLGKSSSRMKSIWLKRKLAGEGDPPEFFQTEEELLQHVANTPGAIGFVHPSKVTDNVKVLIKINDGAG
ncbi:MAG: hypothetical protein AB8G77_28365 [Rhodothermales bacterium]